MTPQMEADRLLAEHREVMAAHYRDCVTRPTQERYEAILSELRKEMNHGRTVES